MTQGNAPVLEVEGLDVRYGRVHAVRDVSLAVEAGEIVALIGPNGGGKTSLLRSLVGAGPGSARHMTFLGEDLRRVPTHVRARRGMVLVPEGRSLFPQLTVEENLRIPQVARRATANGRLAEAIDLFPRLGERFQQRAGSLSGGEQQMLAIARALVSSPRLLLLDEVSLGLHQRIVDDVYAALRHAIAAYGLPALVVEQHLDKALGLSDRAYVMVRGSIVESGGSSALRADAERLTSLYLARQRREARRSRDSRSVGRAEVALTVQPVAKRRLAREAARRGVSLETLVDEAVTAGLEVLDPPPAGSGRRRRVRT